ncbi:MAG TPA: metallophosphoesterase [Candidatus Limnocylindria bacterium]
MEARHPSGPTGLQRGEAFVRRARPWRVLFFTDSHVSFDSKPHHLRWYPSLIGGRMGRLEQWMLNRLDWRSQANLRAVLAQAHDADVVVCGGDATPGEDEHGMLSDAALQQYGRYRNLVATAWRGPLFSAWGNHDVGYHYLRRRVGGVTAESIENAQRLIGPPYQRVELDRWRLLIVSAELLEAAATADHAPRTFRLYLAELAERQRQWIRDELASADRVILVDHDPRHFLKHVWPTVAESGHATKVQLTLTGHIHYRPAAALLHWTHGSARDARLEVIPSTWQMWGIGCGYATLVLDGDICRLAIQRLPPARVPRWWNAGDVRRES